MKISKCLIFSALAAAVTGSTGFCKLIEDGSSFTGNYVVQEESCEKSIFSYVTGQNILVPDFTFEGTPAGLKVDGNLMPIEPNQMFDHGQGVSTGGYAKYQSGNEFISVFFQINPTLNQGQKTVTVDDYVVDNFGEIVKTTTVAIGNNEGSVTGICHYVKSN